MCWVGTLRTQSNHVFVAIVAVFKLNSFALRLKLLINATRSSFARLEEFQAAAA
jgi:hypothetical protein